MAIAYYGYKLSDNIIENPHDGTLVCKNAIIARTGFQVYKGKELPKNEAEALKLEIAPDDDVKVYRSEEEVFAPATIASFEGKPLTDGHPPQLLDIETIADYQTGHIQNIRRGKEPLDSGDWPLLADLILTDPKLIDKVQKFGVRELSCGYNYHLAVVNGNIQQVDIKGNHVAVVENGRAGTLVGIQDEAPKPEQEQEKVTMNFRKLWLAMGFKAWAQNAKPEELAAAMDEASETKKETEANDKAHGNDCACKDCKPAGKDAKANDREKYHAALDKLLDGKEKEQAAQDADMEALKGLLGEKTGATDSEEDKKDGEGKDEDLKTLEEEETEGKDEEEIEAVDEAVQSNSSPKIPSEDRNKADVPGAVDAAYIEGQRAMLKAMRPFVARSKDKALRGAFDTAVTTLRNNPAGSKGSYSAFAKAAATATGMDSDPSIDREAKLCKAADDAYAAARTSARGVKK